MDYTEAKVEMAEEEQLEPLVITEEGDETEGVAESRPLSSLTVIVQSNSEALAPEKEGEQTREDETTEDTASKMCVEKQSLATQETTAEEGHKEENDGDDEGDKIGQAEDTENSNGEQDRGDKEGKEETQEGTRIKEIPEKTCDTVEAVVTPTEPQMDINGLTSSAQPAEGTPSQKDDQKQAHRLTPDFPEALYELLCTLQEGRRLNDQRCSFRLESGVRRRRCHSEPNTTKPVNRVIFSSMTSLQREEFFELVATAQARRLDDQRALLERSPPPKSKARSFRGSIKQLSIVKKPAPLPVPKEDLYNMILTTQAQGRLEDQRSRAPGPMDDEDFFSLLLRVQGGRMEEQRTELPHILQT
ncbi:G-protein-signaling modulator 1 [Myripristis murdjan]|uniref:G-protein-signaling modulator 1 n=1 Tax=Myripristis murdjan TaxID=586833 RepID=UPI001175CAAD|nr:G-protein-signaling modulator 1-like [Myripristis murdjan]XP_029928249.1 G-protein-signaling modulator 1-like [Myripristis murdjan]XP_029928250.1 G-protein-signaling modulator 1-like [Myripristis murdjan]XP_029928251.1 G-protein-signaling modulator 1-like [Myripristis murdjan]XP_029928252.1 G-protein-signaling modulator 1-like [Myripristis murdjan]